MQERFEEKNLKDCSHNKITKSAPELKERGEIIDIHVAYNKS